MLKREKTNGKFSNGSSVLFSRKKIMWYWDIRIWSPLILILFIILTLNMKSERVEAPDELDIVVEEISEEETIPEESTEPEKKQDSDIVALARLADTVARGRSDEVKRIIMWVAINRSEDRSHGYGMSLQEEIARPKQWQEYDPDASYLETTLLLANDVYTAWKMGSARPMYGDMLWFVLNGDGSITVRNQFKEGKNRTEMTFGQ